MIQRFNLGLQIKANVSIAVNIPELLRKLLSFETTHYHRCSCTQYIHLFIYFSLLTYLFIYYYIPYFSFQYVPVLL